jgi:type IV secretion system protein VirB9
VSDVAIGDSARWIATPAQAGDPQGPVTHIVVKPKELGLTTNLVIYTNRHTYHLNLVSRRGFMRSVKFSYPEEVADASKSPTTAPVTGANQAQPGDQSPITPPGTPLDHAYQIAGPQVRWKPVQAFNDGTHVFIQMPSAMAASEAPALMLGDGKATELANYRVRGTYYIVDKLFQRAVMVSGVGREQEQVTIRYAGQPR